MLQPVHKPPKLNLPLYSSPVPAGFPSPADDHIEAKLDLNLHLIKRPAATFFVKVQGDSMKDIGIFEGDLLIVDRSIDPKSDDIVIAIQHGELTVKRLKILTSKTILSAENSEFPDILLDETGCEIWGIVTHNIRQHCAR